MPDLLNHKAGITSMCFSPDGLNLASVDEEGCIIIWNYKTGSI